jgi:hypothetical protein
MELNKKSTKVVLRYLLEKNRIIEVMDPVSVIKEEFMECNINDVTEEMEENTLVLKYDSVAVVLKFPHRFPCIY